MLAHSDVRKEDVEQYTNRVRYKKESALLGVVAKEQPSQEGIEERDVVVEVHLRKYLCKN